MQSCCNEFIHLLYSENLLNVYHMPNTPLGTENRAVNRQSSFCDLHSGKACGFCQYWVAGLACSHTR